MTVAAVLLGLASAGSTAQAQTNDLTGTSQIDTIQRDVVIDMARGQDASHFGNPEFRPGLSGGASLGYSGQSGNSASQEFTAGARLRFASGVFVQNIGLAADYAESAGTRTMADVFAVYDGNYCLNDKVYGFILGRVQTDGLAATSDDVATDAFLGFGPGYRIINTEHVT